MAESTGASEIIRKGSVSMPAISVIVPVYKVENYLQRCVDSILNQTFSDFDLILVDDGSPDRCGEICEAYARQDSRINVIHQENGGLSAARNTGIDWSFANSASQWLAFVDSDDWVAPDFLQQLYRGVSETGCLISACGFFRTAGEDIPEHLEERLQVLSAEDYYCAEDIHEGVTMVAWNKLYHKSLFEHLRYPKGKLHEDEFTTYRAVYAAEMVSVISAPLYAYYQNPQGIMRSKWNPRRMHVLEAVEQQIVFAEENRYPKLLSKGILHHIYGTYDQLGIVKEDKDQSANLHLLRKKLRYGLKLGRTSGEFPLCWEKLWAYEEAYPCKVFWWLLGKGRKLWMK